ncbi:flavodoxin domain-containing protein [Arthrobacter sp. MA-N2]|uniref:flavodoxin domain-containing protein n=1 Tax=Arthrobacter sp. MA-N2 TaxID=1101188 RepID=UPI0004B24DBE|nr:flavodoxin domain-containing protein [Arthrobacter sp. MA-N2]
MTVLVAYASALGSTKEIAQHVASRMAGVLDDVECRAVAEIESVTGYEAVVIGSAIHNQAWLPEASLFVRRHAPGLATRPVWAFSVGMADALPKPFRKRAAAFQQERIARVLSKEVPLRAHRVFSGVYRPSQMPAPLRALFHLSGGRFGDLRDWAAIDAWTDQMTAQLAHTEPSPGNTTT